MIEVARNVISSNLKLQHTKKYAFQAWRSCGRFLFAPVTDKRHDSWCGEATNFEFREIRPTTDLSETEVARNAILSNLKLLYTPKYMHSRPGTAAGVSRLHQL